MLRKMQLTLVLLVVYSAMNAVTVGRITKSSLLARRGYDYSESDSESEDSESETNESSESTESTESKEDDSAEDEDTPAEGFTRKRRKCEQCPEDIKVHWRDPRVLWICGAYQRARRSFKSVCMMQYRNCQDGTMFVKIHDHRCKNDSYHGDHFFYDYKGWS